MCEPILRRSSVQVFKSKRGILRGAYDRKRQVTGRGLSGCTKEADDFVHVQTMRKEIQMNLSIPTTSVHISCKYACSAVLFVHRQQAIAACLELIAHSSACFACCLCTSASACAREARTSCVTRVTLRTCMRILCMGACILRSGGVKMHN